MAELIFPPLPSPTSPSPPHPHPVCDRWLRPFVLRAHFVVNILLAVATFSACRSVPRVVAPNLDCSEPAASPGALWHLYPAVHLAPLFLLFDCRRTQARQALPHPVLRFCDASAFSVAPMCHLISARSSPPSALRSSARGHTSCVCMDHSKIFH